MFKLKCCGVVLSLLAAALSPIGVNANSQATPKKVSVKKTAFQTVSHDAAKRAARLPQAARSKVATKVSPFSIAGSLKLPNLRQSFSPRFIAGQEGSAPAYAMLSYSDEWDEYAIDYGMYSVATDGTGNVTQKSSAYFTANGGGTMTPDGYYLTYYTYDDIFGNLNIIHYKLNPETFDIEAAWYSDSPAAISTNMVYDYTTGLIYGCFYNSTADGFVFASRDFENETITKIADLSKLWHTCAIDRDGTLYAIDLDGELSKVNKKTGELTNIGNLGVSSKYLTSGCIDSKTGELYFATCDDDSSALYVVDKTTAKATLVNYFENGEEFSGMFIPRAVAEDEAPASPTNIQFKYVDNSLSGTMTFDAPTTTYNGEDASGALTYSVLISGDLVASGTTSFGATDVAVSLPAVEKSGSYTFTVYVSNSVGNSPLVTATAYIGDDIPCDPYGVNLEYNNGVFYLSWDPVTISYNNGYIDYNNVKYIITSYPSGQQHTVNYGTNEFEEAVATPEAQAKFYYTVKVAYNDYEGSEVRSNAFFLGNIIPPYDCDFDSEDDLDPYTIIDANEDESTWSIDTGNSSAKCSYNSENDMDDWLILPAAQLEGGKLYQLTLLVRSANDFFPERFEAKIGTAPTAEAMTTTLIEPTELTTGFNEEYITSINIENTGIYYIGIHGISDADQFFLYVDKVSIAAGVSTQAPAAVKDFKVTPNYDGLAEATLTFTTPTTDIKGDNLSSISKIEITRDDEVVMTSKNPSVGSIVNWVDTKVNKGDRKYSVVCYNDYGRGEVAVVNTFIGVNTPSEPTNVRAVETDNLGEVTVSWDAPKTDISGNPLNPALVTYTVINYKQEVLEDAYTGTELTTQIIDEDADQEFTQFGVLAQTESGMSSMVLSDFIAIGKPYEMPVVESFVDTYVSYIWGTSGSWSIGADSDFTDLNSSDGDDGFAYFCGQSIGDTQSFFSGKIHIAGENPALSFMYFPIADSYNPLKVYAVNKNERKLLRTIVSATDFPNVEGWTRVIIPLDDVINTDSQIEFEAECDTHLYVFIDNIHVENLSERNLELANIAAPSMVNPNDEFEITVHVNNYGAEAFEADDYVVNLYCNGQIADTAKGTALKSAESTSIVFHETLGATAEENNEYYAEIASSADGNSSDNTSDTVTVTVAFPQYPEPTDLTATIQNSDVALAWGEPDMSKVPLEQTVEDFETGTLWSDQFGDWTIVDNDGLDAGALYGVSFPYEYGPCAWFILDHGDEDLAIEDYEAHSGEKFMSTMYAVSGDCVNDDWLISPKLSGDAQTISFYAKSCSYFFFETFEVLYSTTDTKLDSFTHVATEEDIPNEWIEYSYSIPAGAKYFAIRCISDDRMMLFVDDVTYAAEGSKPIQIELLGYNVYRDGEKLTDNYLTAKNFTDTDVDNFNHSYQVTAVYDLGESKASEAVTPSYSGLNAVSMSNVKVTTAHSEIIVTGAQGMNISVSAVDGKVINSHLAMNETTRIDVLSGVYLVKVGATTYKVIVR